MVGQMGRNEVMLMGAEPRHLEQGLMPHVRRFTLRSHSTLIKL